MRSPARDSFVAAVLTALTLLVGLLTAAPATATDGTHVGGIIATDTTWPAEAGPYYVDSEIQIAAGATLRIEAGARVVSTRGYLTSSGPLFGVAGTLDVAGTRAEPVVLQANGDPGLTTGLQHNRNALIKIRHADISGFHTLVPASGRSQRADYEITDSVIRHISGSSYFWYPHTRALLERNLFVNVGALTFGTDQGAVATVRDNRFRGSNGSQGSGHFLESWAAYGQPLQVHGNTFERAANQPHALRLSSDGRIDATGNYWETLDLAAVKARVHDREDDLNIAGVVPVEPLLEAPTAATPAGPASSPTGVVATRGDGSATVDWVPPTFDGGAPVTAYDVTASPGGASIRVGAEKTSATLTGLTNGTSYTLSVAAVNSAGPSPVATSGSVVPAGVPSVPASVYASAQGTSARVWWSDAEANGAPLTAYEITVSPGGRTLTVPGTQTSAVFDGLTYGQGYTFSVSATNEVGTSASSAPSAQVVPVAVPSAPTGVTASPGDRRVEVSWSEPAESGGSPIDHYTVTASPGGLTVTVPAQARTATLAPLTNGAAYTFRVTATSRVGDGAPSARSAKVVPAGRPGRVSRPDAWAKGRTATVRWNAVDGNGRRVKAYVIRSSTGKVVRVAGRTRQVSFGSLPRGRHTFTVAAVNAIGTSRASRAARVTIR